MRGKETISGITCILEKSERTREENYFFERWTSL